MSSALVNTIVILSHVPILLAVISAAYLYNKLGAALRVFSYFIFLSGVVQFASLWLCLNAKNNMPLLHFYVAAGLPCVVWFYSVLLDGFISKRIMWSIVLLFIPFTIINTLYIQNIHRFNSNALAVESVIIIILALFTFIFLLQDAIVETGIKDKKSLSWINSGLFIYYVSCLLIFYFGDAIIFSFSKELSRLTWIFHAFFSVIMYSCFIIGLWKRPRNLHL